MGNEARLAYEPAMVPHPGETVAEYLEFYGWTQRDLARRTDLTPKTISEICGGKAPITPPTALAFEKAFRRPAHFWLNLQRQFDEARARDLAAAKHQEWGHWVRRFPLKEMSSFGWLDENAKSSTDALLSFFGVSSPASWQSVWQACDVAYRQTRRFQTSPEAVSAWIRATELFASQLELEFEDFDEDKFRSSLSTLRYQTKYAADKFVPEVQSICALVGVAVVWVPELPKTGISGCARWLTPTKALIALTLRYKTDDQMWFTFFHEIGHILLHRRQHEVIVDNAAEDLTDQIVDPQMQRKEEEANRFAADTLFPPTALEAFIKRNDLSNEAIIQFAEEQHIGPGLVVGRLQREGILNYHQGNALKRRFNWARAN